MINASRRAGFYCERKCFFFFKNVVYEVKFCSKQRADDRIKAVSRSIRHQLTLKCDFMRGEKKVIGMTGEEQQRQLCVLHLMSLTQFQSFTSQNLFKSNQSKSYFAQKLISFYSWAAIHQNQLLVCLFERWWIRNEREVRKLVQQRQEAKKREKWMSREKDRATYQ